MRKSFDWKMATDDEMREHIKNDPLKTVQKQLHYYKRMHNTKMYDRLLEVARSVGVCLPAAEAKKYVKKADRLHDIALNWARKTPIQKPKKFHWATASVDEMAQHMEGMQRRSIVDRIQRLKNKGKWDIVVRVYAALNMFDKGSHK